MSLSEIFEAVDAALAGFFAESVRAIHLEDVSVCEGIQAGLASRHWEPGPLAAHEEALRRFQRWLAERITAE